MNDFNFDENTVNKLKKMINNGNLSDVMAQIPPDMIQNFSSIINNNSDTSNTYSKKAESSKTVGSNFDFSNIDMNTIMKMKSVMDKMNSKNNAGMNLLYSLKPYLRDGRKEKLDQYANLMNFMQIAELLKNDNNKSKENNGNE